MFKKIARGYLKAVELICVGLLCLILACMCIQIGCRLLSIGQNFTEELSRIAFCILVYLGAPLVMTEGADIAVDMVVNMLPKAIRNWIEICVNIFSACFSLLCIRSLVTLTGSNKGVTAVSMTWIQMNWIYYLCMFSFACMFLVTICKIIAIIKGRKPILDINADEKARAQQEESEVDLGI